MRACSDMGLCGMGGLLVGGRTGRWVDAIKSDQPPSHPYDLVGLDRPWPALKAPPGLHRPKGDAKPLCELGIAKLCDQVG